MTPKLMRALYEVCDAIVTAVESAGPLGAPGGVIYAAMMASGCNLQTYETLMNGLVGAGKLRKSGDLYFVNEIRQ
jgi:hypothetical protein